jgi:two-component sensor histidine kinase
MAGERGGREFLRHKPSYGTSVIRDLIPYELEGTVELRFLAEGVQCQIEIPLKRLGNGAS